MSMNYHVSVKGSDRNSGCQEAPFRTISKAALVAEAGDTVTVHEGVYREWVSPEFGGVSEQSRITYQAAEGEHVVIKGSEEVTGWKNVKGTVWSIELDNAMFPYGNPFDTRMFGDWMVQPLDRIIHTAEVYMDGRKLFETFTLESVYSPVVDEIGEIPEWSPKRETRHDLDIADCVWFAEVGDEKTVLYANFQGRDPNAMCTEVTARPFCFFPRNTHRNYITFRGFEVCQCATQWAPPTAFQAGMVGPHWAKGWIIEDCHLHDAKCSAISLGKERSTGHNEASSHYRKPGYQYQFEAVCKALQQGWCKENIGSHIVRNNIIHDCGQNGIVGHMGCAFSEIYDNEIWNITNRHEFFGHEVGGIKLHAAIDIQIHDNRIHDCFLGTWLDWELQGARVTRNIYYRNTRDIFVEVSSGPYLLDDNIFASDYNVDNHCQGGAFAHNLFAGASQFRPIIDRSTPYHYAHSTGLMGSAFTYGGDDRQYNNIYVRWGEKPYGEYEFGLNHWNGHYGNSEEYFEETNRDLTDDHSKFFVIPQPMYVERNMYLGGAEPFDRETEPTVSSDSADLKVVTEDGNVYLYITVPESADLTSCRLLDTADFPVPRITECRYEDPEGHTIVLDTDLFGNRRENGCAAGPLADLKKGVNRILLGKERN